MAWDIEQEIVRFQVAESNIMMGLSLLKVKDPKGAVEVIELVEELLGLIKKDLVE